tara:strand:- start:4650 stop:6050 length:1401 start_codon:yes stop_codon:yes gene_type:complete
LKNDVESWSWANLGWAVFLLVSPNLILFSIATLYGLERPYVNIDYAVVMLLAVLGSRVLAGFALIVAFFFDVLGLVGQIVPILRLADIFYISSFFGMAPLSYQIVGVALLFLLFFFMALFLQKDHKTRKPEFLICINFVVAAYLYSVFLPEAEARQVWSNKDQGAVASQTVFGFNSRKTGFVESLSAEGEIFGKVPVSGATSQWYSDAKVDDRILLIVSESWGVTDDDIQSAVLKPIIEIEDHLDDVQRGSITFKGVTVEAEIRELCQLDLLHFNFEDHKSDLSVCLPNRLKEKGYVTHAFHGAAGMMYDRVRWYPDIGFQHSTFFESKKWPRRCFSFPGACDSDMASHVADSFIHDDKVFSYWLTLNSHHSYDPRDIHGETLDCEDSGIPEESQTCRNLNLHHQFFRDVARLINKPEMAGVRILIVGDHEPPITNKNEKLRYFEENKVPWISFKVPKANGVYVSR